MITHCVVAFQGFSYPCLWNLARFYTCPLQSCFINYKLVLEFGKRHWKIFYKLMRPAITFCIEGIVCLIIIPSIFFHGFHVKATCFKNNTSCNLLQLKTCLQQIIFDSRPLSKPLFCSILVHHWTWKGKKNSCLNISSLKCINPNKPNKHLMIFISILNFY